MRRPPADLDKLADAINSDDPNAFEDIVRLLGIAVGHATDPANRRTQ